MLRTIIGFAPVERQVRSIAMASSLPGEGKSVSCLNLGIAAALSGESVIIVDCDLRRPSMHNLWGLSNEVGLTNVMNGSETLEGALRQTGIDGLRVLTTGPVSIDPFTLLNSDAARSTFEQIKAHADFVLFDTPPALVFADAQVVAAQADAVLLVVSSQESRKNDIKRTRSVLEQTGTKIIGILLNKTIESETYSYSSNYYDGYLQNGASKGQLLTGTRAS
jgi:capsular exopolysaccharide synthesis family protein